MATPSVCMLRAPGTNSDLETVYAFEQAGAHVNQMHLFDLLKAPQKLGEHQILCVPGGFSYGDDISAGVIFASQLRRSIRGLLGEFLQNDTLVLGICNGFQVLLKSGILPDGTKHWPPKAADRNRATLTWNENGRYTALWVKLRAGNSQNVFLREIDEIELPIAHAEGRIAVRDNDVLLDWKTEGNIALQYSDGSENPDQPLDYPANPNGSVLNIAGLSDPTGRVLGLMPHPERFIKATNHPQWTRRNADPNGEGDGMKLFHNAVAYFA